MTNDRDVVDEIDRLVNEQLEQEASGYDHNINQAKCPHCDRDFHGLPITRAMEQMRYLNAFGTDVEDDLLNYRSDEDETPILCAGSTTIGPARPPLSVDAVWSLYRDGLIGFGTRAASPWYIAEPPLTVNRWLIGDPRWWRLDNPSSALDFVIDRDIRVGSTLVTTGPDRVESTPLAWARGQAPYRVTIGDDPRRVTRVEIFAARAPQLGGTWEPIIAPGADVDRRHIDDGDPLLAGRDFTMAQLYDNGWRLVGNVAEEGVQFDPDFVPGEVYQTRPQSRELTVTTQINPSRPYFDGPQINDGDRIGVEMNGRVFTGVARVARNPDGSETITMQDESQPSIHNFGEPS